MCPKPTAAVEPKVQYFQLCEKEVRKEGYKIITVSMFVREVWNTVYLSHMYTHQKYITKWSGGFSVQKAQFLNYIMRSFTLSGLHLRDLMWGWEFHLRVFSWGLLYLKRTCHSGLASTWEASLECCLLHCDQMRSAPSLLFSLSPPLVFFVFFYCRYFFVEMLCITFTFSPTKGPTPPKPLRLLTLTQKCVLFCTTKTLQNSDFAGFSCNQRLVPGFSNSRVPKWRNCDQILAPRSQRCKILRLHTSTTKFQCIDIHIHSWFCLCRDTPVSLLGTRNCCN